MRVVIGWLSLLVGMLGSVSAQPRASVQAPAIAGCWRADRPLGPTGGLQPVERDSAFRTFVLQDSGRVALPLVGEREGRMWVTRSFWEVREDSIVLRVFTGLQGWNAVLTRSTDTRMLSGQARYLTDAIVIGAPPLVVPVALTRIACDRSWPTTASGVASLRPWQRGEALYSAHQVDQAVTSPLNASLPEGLVTVRPLQFDERAALSVRADRAIVELQFVLEKDGRVDTGSVKVLASDGDEYLARARRSLATLRFSPATLKGVPVHQLVAMRFELRR